MPTYINIYTHRYVCIHIYVYIHTQICVYTYICIYTHTHIYTYIWIRESECERVVKESLLEEVTTKQRREQ